ncbi:peroxidase [Roseovarius sp. M141]|nr:peroxidase [Roseovarius sp. M141]
MLERLLDFVLGVWARISDRTISWTRLPFLMALAAIIGHRVNLRHHNLIDTETAPPDLSGRKIDGLPEDFDPREFRMPDGSYNDMKSPWMGMAGARFGRNVALSKGFAERDTELLSPNPREVSRKLMERKEFVPVESLNVMAAAWIQFMVHDWLGHGANDPKRKIEIPVQDDDLWPPNREPNAPNGPMNVLATGADPSRTDADEGRPVTFRNVETHWWDASQVYGSSWARMERMRREGGKRSGARLENGKFWVDERGLLPLDEDMQEKRPKQELSGVNGNWWIGLSLLHTLFTREHNAIVDRLRIDHPNASGEWLFQKARLVNAALIAKIHTVEWTPALMDSDVGRMAMRGNFYGLSGERLAKGFGLVSDSEVVAGIPGTPTDHHGSPYAMTEEFTAVYRLHALLPDQFEFRSSDDDRVLFERNLTGVAFGQARTVYDGATFDDALYSLSTQPPGAMVLHNFPNTLRNLSKKPEEGVFMDLAAVDILRDRERGVPRYCAFREALGMPKITSFEELTSVEADQKLLREVYGTIDRVDLLIGCMAEFQSSRQPKGFGFSDTAFRIFILMASRRLKSDRFFSTDFTPEIYTPAGYSWVQSNGFRDVIRRHSPALAPHFDDVRNVFYPWDRAG